MKLVTRNWQWLGGLFVIGLVCATYLIAQTPTTQTSLITITTNSTSTVSPPNAQEAADATTLIDAVNSGDYSTALAILHNYGVADGTLSVMAANLGTQPAPIVLQELFLKASLGAISTGDWTTRTNLQASLQNVITNLGYQRPVWIPHRYDTTALQNYSTDLLQAPFPPVVQLEPKLSDANFIRWFLWCDHYIDYVHSIAINGANLSNTRVNPASYEKANRTLNALFQLIKARRPDVFVWLGVVRQDNLNDEQWLRAMTFKPDGLQIWNLSQFHSAFARTYSRYSSIVGTNMPMMVVGFYGYGQELQSDGDALVTALQNKDQTNAVLAIRRMGAIGRLIGNSLSLEETNLQSLGYRGLSVQWPLLLALASTNNAPLDRSNLVDPRAGLLDGYFLSKKYGAMISIASDMISNSAPGDMNWTVGKLYAGMALLNTSPPKLQTGNGQLDDVIAFNYTNRPGRDHYILGAVKWRIYGASISGDTNTPRQLVQWVQNQNLQRGMKADFMRVYGDLLPATNN